MYIKKAMQDDIMLLRLCLVSALRMSQAKGAVRTLASEATASEPQNNYNVEVVTIHASHELRKDGHNDSIT